MQKIQETQVQSLGWYNPLEEEMATHSSIFAWKIPQTEEPSRLQSMGSQELDTTERMSVRVHAHTHTHTHTHNPNTFSMKSFQNEILSENQKSLLHLSY